MRSVFLVAFTALFLGGIEGTTGLAATGPDKTGVRRPNILFILCDDLGINDLHCYGRKDHHTPNLDHLAQQGMRFTSAYCAQRAAEPGSRRNMPSPEQGASTRIRSK